MHPATRQEQLGDQVYRTAHETQRLIRNTAPQTGHTHTSKSTRANEYNHTSITTDFGGGKQAFRESRVLDIAVLLVIKAIHGVGNDVMRNIVNATVQCRCHLAPG